MHSIMTPVSVFLYKQVWVRTNYSVNIQIFPASVGGSKETVNTFANKFDD